MNFQFLRKNVYATFVTLMYILLKINYHNVFAVKYRLLLEEIVPELYHCEFFSAFTPLHY